MPNRTSKTGKQTTVTSVGSVARHQVDQKLPVVGAEANGMEVHPAVQSVADAAMRLDEGEEGFTVGSGMQKVIMRLFIASDMPAADQQGTFGLSVTARKMTAAAI
jgi:pyridoxal biosynthesis lyase PdxS